MTQIRLSICIATRNRGRFIAETLLSIVPQLTDEAEIVIVDGASTDNTPEVVREFCRSSDRVRYVRLEANGGVDRDYCICVEHAHGQMVWLFADDDLLKLNSVKTVLKHINTQHYSLVIVNAEVCSTDLSSLIQRRLLDIESDKCVEAGESTELFELAIDYLSFIGCVVIDRGLWLDRQKAPYFGSEFVHVGVIFQEQLPRPVLILAEPLIRIRFGNALWSRRAFEIWMVKWPRLLASFDAVTVRARHKYVAKQSTRRLKQLLVHRAKGEYSVAEYEKWLRKEATSATWRLVAFLIASFPVPVVRTLLTVYLRVRNRDALLWWHP